MKKRKQKTKANSGKLLMTQTKAGVDGDVSVIWSVLGISGLLSKQKAALNFNV